MNKSSPPVACLLTDAQLQQRRTEVLLKAKLAVLEMKELEDGFAYRFPGDDNWLSELTHIISLERQCCPFLRFRLTVEPDNGPVWLELTGPEGTKNFLRSLFS